MCCLTSFKSAVIFIHVRMIVIFCYFPLANACFGLVKICECVSCGCLERNCQVEHPPTNDAFIHVLLGIKEITKYSVSGGKSPVSAIAVKYSQILTSNLVEGSSDYRLVKSLSQRPLPRCFNPACSFRDQMSDSTELKKCSRCSSMYCSRECQLAHWPKHKAFCSTKKK